MNFRNPYNYDRSAASKVVQLDTSGDEMLTQQHMRDECDINVIVDRFLRTGQMPDNIDFADIDVSDVGDYHDALNIMREAQEQFDALPSKLRDRFHNDPGQLLAFIHDPKNQTEAVTLGLVKPVEAPLEPVSPPPSEPVGTDST